MGITADRNGRLGDLGVVRFRRLVALGLSGKAIHLTQPASQIGRTTETASGRKLRPVGSRPGDGGIRDRVQLSSVTRSAHLAFFPPDPLSLEDLAGEDVSAAPLVAGLS